MIEQALENGGANTKDVGTNIFGETYTGRLSSALKDT